MMRAAVAALALLLATDPAGACHRYSHWAYPRPQSCRMTALAPRSALRLSRARIDVSLIPPPPHAVAPPTPDMPLPSLTDIEWGTFPDDELRGRLLLRVLLQGKGQ